MDQLLNLNVLNVNTLTIVISIIWGFGFACLIKNVFTNGDCVIIEEQFI